MLNIIFAFTPMAVALAGFLAFFFKKSRGYAQRAFTMMLFFMTVYYFADGCLMLRDMNYRMLVFTDILSQFSTPAVLAASLILVKSMYKDISDQATFMIYMAPAFVLGGGSVIVYSVAGIGSTASYFHALDSGNLVEFDHPLWHLVRFWTYYLYLSVLLIEMIILLAYIVSRIVKYKISFKKFWRFVFKGGTYRSDDTLMWLIVCFMLVCFVRIAFGRQFLVLHPALSAALSLVTALVLSCGILVAYVPKQKDVTLKSIFTKADWPKPNPQRLIPKQRTEEKLKTIPLNRLAMEQDAERIYMLLVGKKYCHERDASAEGAAQLLGMSAKKINATTLTLCSCDFSDLVAYCREHIPIEE